MIDHVATEPMEEAIQVKPARSWWNGIVWRLKSRWIQNRDVQILDGLGRGLWINIAEASFEYALGTNEPAMQEVFETYVRPGQVFYDIGANIGYFTIIGARLVGPEGRVHAFEPVPANAAAVRHNCSLNGFGRVTVWENAVSDHSGRAEMYLAEYAGGSALTSAAPPPDVKGRLAVQAVAIDDLVQRGAIEPPDFVKVDVEGAEMSVLRGMQETLDQYRPVIVYEIDDGDSDKLAQKRSACREFLSEYGYVISRLPASYAGIDWLVEHYVAVPVELLS